ncbi:hypothetical protein [Aquimarina sediminis]|uniref:hypothetical protein n=1 Tax=Aquimarina sediminis TaxID=2070536 RepID=UPI000CA00AD4|nr:hypothetical protein [Aquimarina sediminis]
MTKKEIDTLIKKENGVILLKKDSEETFLESFFGELSVLTFVYFLIKRKIDYLILTEQRVLFIIRNKIIENRTLTGTEKVVYNGIKPSFEINTSEQQYSFSLRKLRVSYEESKLIRQRISEFENSKQ